MLWDTTQYTISDVVLKEFSITALVKPLDGCPWTISTVYGPHDDQRRASVLLELQEIANSVSTPWLVLGDFNLITSAADKNNPNVDRRWMLRFRNALHTSSLTNNLHRG